MRERKERPMKNNRIIALLLLIATLLSLIPTAVTAEEALPEKSPTVVLACSDFQADAGNEAGKANVKKILAAMAKEGFTSADGFLCCGDYDIDYDDTKGGIKALTEAVKDVVSENMVFVQGNHDSANSKAGTNGLSVSGNNDPESGEYGVFVLNEEIYMQYNDNEGTIKRTAQKLINYLNEKLAQGYDRPIFVTSHLPLHYSMRCHNEGDARHASYIFDVLNEAGAKGLNIIFLFGHDHSNGWDDYIGGASVYLEKGDKILIPQHSKTKFNEETLNFTYMNAGYVGYYRNVNGADSALTMTTYTITEDSVEIARYSKEGVHNLKSAGVTNSYRDETAYPANTEVYPSPRTLTLTEVTDRTPIADLIPNTVEVKGTGQWLVRVTSVDELTDGGKYMIVHSGEPYAVMLPNVVSKSDSSGNARVGFDLETTNKFGADNVYGDWEDKAWTLTKSGDKWLVGSDGGYVKLAYTEDTAVAATLEAEGSLFSIKGSEDAFTFVSDFLVLNYNARGLISGFSAKPAPFYIYRFAGYSVNADGGDAPWGAAVGDTVTVAATPPAGYSFNGWKVLSGDVTISDAASESATFIMPAEPVRLKADYVLKVGTGTTPDTWENPFNDVEKDEWYYSAVHYATDNELMNGTGIGVFAPNVNVSRAMIVTVLYRLEGSPDVSDVKTPFTDVEAKEWYADAIAWAYKNGVVNGTSPTTFAPTGNLTREQFATILYRYADEVKGRDVSVDGTASLDKYSDRDEVSGYAYDALLWTNYNGFIGGVSATKLSPKSGATRAQMATILYRFITAE